MRPIQVRFTPQLAEVTVKLLDGQPLETLTPDERHAAAEFAARLRYRAVKLWGADDIPPELLRAAG